MNEHQAVLLLIKGVIAEFPEDQQLVIKGIVERLRAEIEAHGDLARVAIGLLGAEHAAAAG